MAERNERIARVVHDLVADNLDAIVCAIPANVLMLSGYWPVVGTAVAIVTRDGVCVALAPEDERELAARGWAEVRTYQPGSLGQLINVTTAITDPLKRLGDELGLARARIGFEAGPFYEPSSYAAMHFFGGGMLPLLAHALPEAVKVPADELLSRLKAVKTLLEIGRIRTACRIAADAYQTGAGRLVPAMAETEAAASFQAPLSIVGTGFDGAARAGGFVSCMSGANSAQAFGAFARSRGTAITTNEPILVHCNSYADGYWTDITRTFCLGEIPPDLRLVYDAVLAARQAALLAVGDGARAATVDKAARDVLAQSGYGADFKHGTGHGVGFAAINHLALPRIHPASEDVLETGNVFNIEPAVYIEGKGGVRHCDVVAITEQGVEVLTPFQSEIGQLLLGGVSNV